MSAFWSIVKRETDERRLLMLGALALGFLPFAVALIPWHFGKQIGEARLELAIILAGVATGVTALFLGFSVIARDLAERRLSFYFSHPVPPWIIWGGKMTAALGLSLVTGFLIVLPTLITGARPVDDLPPAWPVLATVLALFAIVGVAHALSVQLRARSPWLLLDLAGGLTVALLVLAARAPLVRLGIPEHPPSNPSVLLRGYLVLAVVAVVAVLAAGAVQVAVGRTDPRRGHKALSLALWSVLLPAALLFLGFSRWVTQVEPRDLKTLRLASSAPAGPWVVLVGPARHRPGYWPTFLFDSSTGRAVRINAQPSKPSPTDLAYPLLFSNDGKRAVWLEPQPFPIFRLMSLDLAQPASRPLPTPVFFEGAPQEFALSADATRFAAVQQGRLLVHGLPRGELLASAPLPEPGVVGFVEFDGPGQVQVVRLVLNADRPEKAVVRYRLEIATRKMTSEDIGRSHFGSWREAPMPLGRHTLWFKHEKGRLVLIVGSGDGVEKWRVPFPGAKTFNLGGQPAADQVVVWTEEGPPGRDAQDVEVFLLDLAKGKLRPLARGLWPIEHTAYTVPTLRLFSNQKELIGQRPMTFWPTSTAQHAAVGAPTTQLFYNEKELVRIDPETGQRRMILRLS